MKHNVYYDWRHNLKPLRIGDDVKLLEEKGDIHTNDSISDKGWKFGAQKGYF